MVCFEVCAFSCWFVEIVGLRTWVRFVVMLSGCFLLLNLRVSDLMLVDCAVSLSLNFMFYGLCSLL